MLATQRALARLPAGVVRDADGRLWAEIDGMELVLVPEGEFSMGSNDGDDDEKPVHRVFVSAVLVDRHEVTNEQFGRFVKSTGHRTDAEKDGKGCAPVDGNWRDVEGVDWCHPEGPGSSVDGRGTHPVVLVSWNDAAAYAQWAGRRLPTEAEFEKALRGGREGLKYPWGDAETPAGRPGNYADETFKTANPNWTIVTGYDDGHERKAPAGSFEQNGLGLFDVSGNVWEWCSDWYDPDWYAQSPPRDPQGPSSGSFRVLRGGSWYDYPLPLRAAYRVGLEPTPRFTSGIGFRCARDLP